MEQGRGGGGASQRLASWLAWAVCALSLTLTALDFLLIAMNVSLNTPAYVFWPELTSLAVGYSVIGAIIASRLPNHPIGWICCAIGLDLLRRWTTSLASTPSTPYWRSPTRFRAVGRCSGSRAGSGCYSSASSCSCSYCFQPVGCPAGAGALSRG
jgi:hypothetical protein